MKKLRNKVSACLVACILLFFNLSAAAQSSVYFNVSAAGSALEGATVQVIGIGSQTTDSNGDTVFVEVAQGNYAYTVSMDGYSSVTDSVAVDSNDVQVDVSLEQIVYNVAFTVTDGTDPLANVSLSFNGSSQSTDANGQCSFSDIVPATDLAYTATLTGYHESSGTLTVADADVDQQIEMDQIVADVSFTVTDRGTALSGATVTLTGYGSQSTDANGQTTFSSVAYGTTAYTVTADNFEDYSGEVSVSSTDAVSTDVALLVNRYSVSFTVADEDAAALSGASISFTDYTAQSTDASGATSFTDVPPGTYDYSISLSGYHEQSGSVEVSTADISQAITLELIVYNVAFTVTDGTDPLANVSLSFNGSSQSTDANGQCSFSDIVPATDLAYTATLTGYHESSGTLTVADADVDQQIEMDQIVADVSFTVTDRGTALSGATVTLTGYGSQSTDVNGQTTFSSVAYGTTAYTVTADNFEDYSGEVSVSSTDAVSTDVALLVNRYSVSFTVADEDAVALSGASISFTDYTAQSTDASGATSFTDVPPGTYDYSISLAGYHEQTGSVEVSTADISQAITLELIVYNVAFTVTDGTDPLANVSLSFNGSSQSTDANGQCTFSDIVPATDMAYTATLTGYHESSGTLTVADADVEQLIEMDQIVADVSFTVTDRGTALSGATVTLTGYGSQSTDVNGQTTFSSVAYGTTAYTVTADNFEDYSGEVSVSSTDAVSTDVALLVNRYSVSFTVADEDAAALSGASISFTDYTAQSTDASGATSFTDVPPGTYDYSISLAGYHEQTGSVEVSTADISQAITLELIVYNVAFTVTDGTDPLANVSLSFNGSSQSTDANGQCSFSDIVPATDLAYTATLTGYHESSGTLTVADADVDQQIEMDQIVADVSFTVTDRGTALSGATVTLTGYGSQSTDANGQTTFSSVAYGTTAYTVTADNFEDYSGEVTVSSTDAVSTDVALLVNRYSVSFTVADEDAAALSGASISFTDYTAQSTDASGATSFTDVPPGTYDYSISLAGYHEQTGSVEVSTADISQAITLELIVYNVAFTVTDGTDPLANVSLSFNGSSQSTDANGQCTFSDIVPATDLAYTATLTGYHESSGTLTVADADVDQQIEMDQIVADVSFTVTDRGTALSGATVTLTGYGSQSTDANGQTTFSSVAYGTTAYTVTADNFEDYSGEVTVSSTDALTVAVPLVIFTYPVTFEVTDEKNKPISGAQVFLDGFDIASTDSNGELTIEGVYPGETSYTIIADGYHSYDGIVTVSTTSVSTSIQLELIVYTVSFTVTDGIENIEGAKVTLYNYGTFETPEDGTVVFEDIVPEEALAYSVKATGYLSEVGEVAVTGDVFQVVAMDEITAPVTFVVKDRGDPVENAMVSLDAVGISYTDETGEAVFEAVPYGSTSYNVSATGFYSKEGYVSVTTVDSVEKTVDLSIVTYQVTFTVTDDELQEVEGAVVLLDGLGSVATNAAGEAIVSDIEPGDYNYTIEAEGYYATTGVLSVIAADVSQPVSIELIKYTVVFTISDGTNAIQNALVDLDGYSTIASDSNGKATFENVKPGSIGFSIEANAYENFQGTIIVSDTNVVQEVIMRLINVRVDFFVFDREEPLEGALVVLDGYGQLKTDDAGQVTFSEVDYGQRSYTVSARNFTTYSGDIYVYSEDSIVESINLDIIRQDINFQVYGEFGENVNGAVIAIEGYDSETTGYYGSATVSDVAPDTLQYIVNAQGYEADTGQVIVDDTAVNVAVYLIESRYAVNVTLLYDDLPVAGAELLLSDYAAAMSDSNGLAVVYEVYREDDIPFVISCPGYQIKEGSLSVGYEDVDTALSLTRAQYNVTFVLMAGEEYLADAFVDIAGLNPQRTTRNGRALFEDLYPATYVYTITLEGYNEINDSLQVVDQDITQHINLTPTTIQPKEPEVYFVYPNPATQSFRLLGAEGCLVRLYDVQGQLVLQMDVDSSPYEVNVSDLKEGVYLLFARNIVQRIVIQDP